jgi:hypothetical protein
MLRRRFSFLRGGAECLYLAALLSVEPASPLLPTPGAATEPVAVSVASLELIADTVDFDWRSHGVSFHVGCRPQPSPCTPGAYEIATRRIYIAEPSFGNGAYLHYVVLHELAHAWQFAVRGWPDLASDLTSWNQEGNEGMERAADCLAAAWGARTTSYWVCPDDARHHLHALYRTTAPMPPPPTDLPPTSPVAPPR